MLEKIHIGPFAAALMAVGLAACGGDSDGNNGNNNQESLLEGITVPDTYAFETQLEGKSGSSVAYPGQTARLVLIKDLDTEIGTRLKQKVEDGTWDDQMDSSQLRDEVRFALDKFYDKGTDTLSSPDTDIRAAAFPDNIEQKQYSDLSGGKDLQGKIAGNDDVTEHRDWDGGGFVGWSAGSPDLAIDEWFTGLVDNVEEEINSSSNRDNVDVGATSTVNLKVYETEHGVNYQQLVEKFLYGAVSMSQGMDDYLDDDEDGKGLLTDNTSSDDGAPYTALEHQFDEGFGYYGAARNLKDYETQEIAGDGGRMEFANGYNDANGDGLIDLESEINLLHAPNAASRDLGSQSGAETDFTGKIFQAFLNGRAIINNAVGRDLNEEEMAALKAQRNIIVENWEKAMGATVIHYINATLGDMDKFGDANYNFHDHTVHWGEMKGYGLTMQFNPRSPLLEDNDGDGTEDFKQLHDLMGEAPVLPDGTQGGQSADIQQYKDDLESARALLKQAYGFADDNVQNW